MSEVYEQQKTNVFPGSVKSVGWSGGEYALVQDVAEGALYDSFDSENSAQLTKFIQPQSVTENVPDVLTDPEVLHDGSTQIQDGALNSADGSIPFSDADQSNNGDVSAPTSESNDTEAGSAPAPADPEPVPDVEQEESTNDASPTPDISGSPVTSVFEMVRGVYELALGAFTDPVGESEPETIVVEETVVEEAPTVQAESSEVIVDEPALSDTASDTEVSNSEIIDASVDNATVTENEAKSVSELIDETSPEQQTFSVPESSSMCGGEKCYTHVMEFSDFGVGDGFDEQQITNMQLRVSLAARPHAGNNGNDIIRVEYEHYDYWIDGGVIPITDEVSNAMNGGYQLFAFPLYSEWDEMKRIKVRFTYESDNEHLADVFVDSVWLEVESINGNAFNESVVEAQPQKALKEQKLRKTIPSGYIFDTLSSRAEFTTDENPRFVFRAEKEKAKHGIISRVATKIKGIFGFEEEVESTAVTLRIVNEEYAYSAKIIEDNGTFTVDIPKTRQFKPGKHVITIEVIDGENSFFIDQEFSWGVLALNVDKSIYLPNEEAYIQMGVIDDLGHTICNARLALTITSPSGLVTNLSTDESTISYGEECAGDTFTTTPDYYTHFDLGTETGEYALELTAETENGTRSITDSFEVREAVAFDIVRTGPTRIYPPEPYPVTLTITANEDYQGSVIEYVPVGFQVYPSNDSEASFRTHDVSDARQLIWDVSLTAGETINLAYYFDAPDLSPEFYLLGPLEVGAFKELRDWQIASDAPSNAVIVQSVMGTEVSGTTYSATFGSAPASGNIIIMVATFIDNPVTFTGAASFLTQAVVSNAAAETDTGIWYAASNPATSTYSIGKSGGNQTGVVYLMEVSGLNTANPLNVVISNDQTGTNSLTASTSLSATSSQYAFAVAGITFADNDFAVPTTASWSSASAAAYTQRSSLSWATGNDGTFSVATADINVAARQGATQVLTVGGTEQRNSVLAVFNLAPQVATIGSRGNQASEIKINTNNNYVGGAFTVLPTTGHATVTSMIVTETGTTDAQNDLSSIRLYYEMDSTAPYDCASSTYDGNETQYGATSTSFSSANGTTSFTANVRVASTSMMCIYPVLNVDSSATAGHTLELQISTPNTQVVMSEGSTTPGTAVAISDTSTLVIGFAPTTPTLTDTPAFPYMKSTSTQPALGGFVSTDADGDALEFEFLLDDDPAFGSPEVTSYTSDYPTDAGWAGSSISSGATTTYQLQEVLASGSTYWWKVRARDPLNTNTWSQYSVSRSVTISDASTIPAWFQTTEYQFATSTTLTNATTSGGSVEIVDLDSSVSLLDAWSTGGTKAVSAGTDRVLIVAIASEDSGTSVNVNTVTYGGQTLTEITDQQIGSGFSNGLWLGYLNEAGIAAAANTTITPTWTGGTPDNNTLYTSAVFANVNQSSPIRGSSGNVLTSGTSITPASSISVLDGDMSFYIAQTENAHTHTPSSGYTEGTDQDLGGNDFAVASAYKAATTSTSEFPTATWSGTAGNRLLIVNAALVPSLAEGIVMSPAIDFDWVSNQNDWGEISWDVTEPAGSDTRLRVYYGTSTPCSTIIPDSALASNAIGFPATSSPLNISALATSTYNTICLRMSLEGENDGVSPTLNHWNVSWELSPLFTQISYQWYANTASATPTDTWPAGATTGELGMNEPINTVFPTKTNDVLRLRMGVEVSSVDANSKTFALQYSEGSSCSTNTEWASVGAIGSTTAVWRGYNISGLTDGQTLAASTLTGTDDLETFEEENLTAAMPNTISVGDSGEWDFALQNRALAGTEYCFRMTNSDGSPFIGYTQYPHLITNDSPDIASIDTPFDNEKASSTLPVFEFTGADPEAESIDYQIQIDNDADFASAIIDTNSVSNLVDFLNINTPADKSPFNDSETIRYSIPSALTNGVTYWWRVRAVDTNGSTLYGDWTTARSFTIDTSITRTTWYQTTEEQFDTDTLVDIDATASDLVTLATGSTTGTTTSSEIDFDNVTVGNAWGSLAWNDSQPTGDIKYHIEYYNGSDWVLIPDAALAGNSTGYETSPVDLIDLDTETYNQIRIRANFTNSGGAPTLSDWTVSWGMRVSVPTHLTLFDNEKTPTTTPTFTFFTTDPEGEDLEYEFSWSADNTFATGSTTRNSSTSPEFINTESGGDLNPFDSGSVISFVIPTSSPLTNGSTYWWRLRAKDPDGSGSFSFWSEPLSFTVDTNATTSTWFQTTQEQFDTDTLLSLVASTSDSVSTIAAGVTTYNFSGITNPSTSHIARYFEVGVSDPTDPPTVDEIDTLTILGTAASTPNLRTAILGYNNDAEATTAQYTAISSSNDTSWTTPDPGNGDQAIFWAEFTINEDPSDIDQIDITIEARQSGVPAGTDKGWFGIWRPGSTTPYWQHASSSQQTADAEYTFSITTNISEYFDGNNDIHILYFNEDDSDPVIIDYAEVVVTTNTADSGTLTGTSLDFNDGSGPAWGQMYWTDSEPGLSSISYQLQYLNGAGSWVLIPDGALAGNSTGFTTSPIDLRFLDTDTYNEIRPIANFDCNLSSCPTLNDWTIEWSRGFTVSGTAFEYDGVASTTSGTVAIAVNGVVQTGKTSAISNGSWSISNVTFFEDDIITAFVSGALDADEAVGVAQYDGVPDVSGLVLRKRHLAIGSDDYQTFSHTEIGNYDATDDEDLFFDVTGDDLAMCADVGCSDASILVLPRNTYDPGVGADIVTHDFINNGTFTSGANTIRVSGSWDDNATSTLTSSSVIFTATSSAEGVDETNATTTGFTNVVFGETSGTATWTASSSLDINGTLHVTYGTLSRGAQSLTIAGSLTTGANGYWTGMGTTTFDGTNPSTWTDQNAVQQNIGRVVVDGTSKTLLLGSNATMQSLTIGANDTFDASVTGYTASVYLDWINNNTFTARTGRVNFVATTTGRIITAGSDPFYNLNFSGVGGSWAFTEADLTITNDLTIATGTVTMPTGTTTLAGSFNAVGGTFAHNNALVYFTSTGAETISASGTPFTNAFYNLRFTGSGSWSFLDTYATTSNDILITQGSVTFPSANLTVGGSFTHTGGSFAHNSGTVSFTSALAETIDVHTSSFNSLAFSGSGSWSFVDASATALGSVWINTGTLTLPSSTFTIGGSYGNSATVTHNNGTVVFSSTDAGETINFGASSLYNVTMNGVGGGWTMTNSGTTTNNFTLATTSLFTLASGQTLSVGATFTNNVQSASTTWTGSTLSLESGNYTINSKTNQGDTYDTLRIKANTDIKMWNSSASTYVIDSTGSLYSQDHAGVDGDLYVFGAYERTSGAEYWSYNTDFDGTSIASSTRNADVRFASGASATLTGSHFIVLGTNTATTTVANQGSGTYTIASGVATTTMNYYQFSNLGTTGVTLSGTGTVSSLSYGLVEPGINAGTGFTISSTTIDANPGFQIYGVNFSTTSAISATNVTQNDGVPVSYWWFRESTGNIDGEAFDADNGDPGSIRWDDSSLVITLSGILYSDDGITPMGAPVCDDVTQNIRIVVNGSASSTGSCASADGTFSIPGVVVVGDPVITAYLDTNGGAKGTVVTRTPTSDITDFNMYQNRVITRHEDVAPLTISNMAVFDATDDSDVRFTAATGTTNTLTVFANTELHIASSTTFAPGGDITIQANASSTSFDGSLHIDDNATLTGSGTSTYTIGGSFTMDNGATFTAASTTVLMNATTTGKTITTTATQEIAFYNLVFNGAGGGWNINGDIQAEDIDVTTGTVTGTADIDVVSGSLSGNGTLSMGAGTTTIQTTNTLGGTTAWTFANLVLGNGVVTGTTTPASDATTTILGKLTIATGHNLDAGSSYWNLAGIGNVFVESGTFHEDTSTVRYSGAGATNILSTSYYNLDLKAQASSPTYTATGLGIIVSNNLTIGGATTTSVTFDTSDPALDVNGNVTIDSTGTLVGSGSGAFTVAGSWDNNGTYTGSNGTITFDGVGATTISAGSSSFSNVIINGAGTFTVNEHATSTGAFTLTSASAFTLASAQSLAVGTTFTNSVGGGATTWTGSTLYLYGGGNYSINASTTLDSYETLRVANGTQIRMWNSDASAYDIGATGSLYSQDHANVSGDLNIYGAYAKTSGTDYWNYATDFDGTSLSGSERKVDVFFASGASAVYTGGGLSIIGDAGNVTTLQNQGSGTYGLRVGGTASTTMNYYAIRNINSSGLTFSGTPNVISLSHGDFEVSQNSGTAITVGGTVITQNPAKTFNTNVFATSTGISPAYNVTATGTSLSSWRFTSHTGSIAGEAFDVDPNGDPGYITWDDSAALITISGNVYADEGSTVSTACDGSTQNIHLRVAGLPTATTSCNAGTGAYSISNVAYSPGDALVVYIKGETEKASTVTEDPISSISNMDLYENRVIVRHESTDPLSIADMALWDSSDDVSIPFTAVDGGTDTLTLPANTKLIVWTGKEFEPNGNVTVSGGGGGSAYDGTLELYTNATFDATGSETHTIGGSLISGSGAIVDDETSTFVFTTTGAARTIDTNDGSFYNLTLNGSGSWTISNTTLDIGNDFTITQGAVTLPSATTTITGSLSVTGGSFNANGGLILFNSAGAETIRAGASNFNALTINGTGSFTMLGTNATVTTDVRIVDGTFTSATGTLAIGGNFINSDTFTHGSGVLRFTSASSVLVTANGSDLYSTVFTGNGPYTFTDTNVALGGSLTIQAGSVTLATGTMSIAGSLLNTGGSFAHSSGTILFNSADSGETINPGGSLFGSVMFGSATGGWTITGDATTTSHFTLSTANNFTLSSSTRLAVGGVFTNLVGGAATTWTGSTLAINSGSTYTINTKLVGGDTYNNLIVGSSTALRAWDSTGSVTMADASSSFYSQDNAGVAGALSIYGNYSRSTGADYWSYATDFDGTALNLSSRQVYVYIAGGATTTLNAGTLNIVGANGFDTTISNQGSGTYALRILGGTLNAQYYSLSNMDASGLVLSNETVITSLAEGNYTLAVNGGTLITVSSTTVNYNSGLAITAASFATTTAITGYNVAVVGTTPSTWTFSSHTGNFDGEGFDSDGIDDCGSIRWDDSECLLTQQSAYRFRNDDGGEGIPNSEWYDLDWSTRKRVAVTNADAVSYTNATVKLTVAYDSDMQSDFDDLRFTANDGTTAIKHFIETYTASTEATVWVQVPLLATSTATEVYMYYGNGTESDGSASTTFSYIDTFEDGSDSEYSGDVSLFAVDGTFAYERAYGLDATGNEGAKATDGIYRTDVSVSQGQTIRFLQYIDTSAGSGDETCTLFGVQSPGSSNQNYAVCLELFGVDRVSISRDVDFNDTSGTVLASTTIAYSTGWYEVEVDWDTDDSIFVSVYQNEVLVATTTATDSNYTTGGVGFTFWFQNGGWDIYSARPFIETPPTVVFGGEQVSGGASWIAALNTPGSGVDVGDTMRVRFLVENTGLPVTNQNYELEFAAKGVSPSCEAVNYSNYVEVPEQASCGTSDICMQTSSNILNLAATTDVLGGEGTFTSGQIIEDPSNNTGNLTINGAEFTELEYVVTPTINVTDSRYCFRVSNEGTDLDAYSRIAEFTLVFEPTVTALSLNGGADITLTGGATTTVTATGTASDLNGYTDLVGATTTIYRSGVNETCTADNNNCYIAGNSQCSFVSCSGNSCDVSCSIDMYYHADPTDIGTYAGETWRAQLAVSDASDAIATGTAPSIDLITLRAIEVDSAINYGTLEADANTGSYNATTTIENIGNDTLDISVEGTDLTDGGSSIIPVSEQIFATTTFTYSACTLCSQLDTTPVNLKLDLSKPASTTPAITDQVFWGISVPFGVAGTAHQGNNIFYAIGEL